MIWPGAEGIPSDSSSLQSSQVRDRLDALYWMDLKPARVEAESPSPSMRVYVHPTYGRTMRLDTAAPLFWAGGYSATLSAPSTNPRYDLMYLVPSGNGSIGVVTGTEAASPSVPLVPDEVIPIAILYMRVGMTSIKNVDDSSNGYIFYRIQPFMGMGGSISVKDRTTANVTVVSTTAETTLWTKNIAGGTLGSDKLLSVTLVIPEYDSDSAETCAIRFKYGGVTVTTITISMPGTTSNATGVIKADLYGDGATNAQLLVAEINLQQGGGSSNIFRNIVVASATVDSAANQDFTISADFSNASAANKIVFSRAHLRKE
jgi:hypothetical protein